MMNARTTLFVILFALSIFGQGATSTVFAQADSLSLNFGPQYGAPTGGVLGAHPVSWQYWNNMTSDYTGINAFTTSEDGMNYNVTGTFSSLKSSFGYTNAIKGAWESPNTWNIDSSRPSTDNNAILYYGYLDDHPTRSVITMASPFFSYDIYYYPSADESALHYGYVEIGAKDHRYEDYYGDDETGTVMGKNYWGTPVKNVDIDSGDLVEGVNYLKVASSDPDIFVRGTPWGNIPGTSSRYRGSIGALQIVNTANSQSLAVAGNMNWHDPIWRNDLTGETNQTFDPTAVGHRIVDNGESSRIDMAGLAVNLNTLKFIGTGVIELFDGNITLGQTDTIYDFRTFAGNIILPNLSQLAPQSVVMFTPNDSISNPALNQSIIPGAYYADGDAISFVKVENGLIKAVEPTYAAHPTDNMDLITSSAVQDNNDRVLNSLTTVRDYINDKSLTITSGMVTFQANNHWIKGGGTITSGYKNADGEYDLYLCALSDHNDMRIDSSTIVDNPDGKLNLIKTGSGLVSLSNGNGNGYTGRTSVLEGTLHIAEPFSSTEFYIASDARVDFASRSYAGDVDFVATSLTGNGNIRIGYKGGNVSLTLNNAVNDGSMFVYAYIYGQNFTLNDSQFHAQWIHLVNDITLNGNSELYCNEVWMKGRGVITINDNSTFTATTFVQMGTGNEYQEHNGYVPAEEPGTVVKIVQNGGVANIGNLGIGVCKNFVGMYEMNGGVLNVGISDTVIHSFEFADIWLADLGGGTLIQRGGEINTRGIELQTKEPNAETGKYVMTGGELNMGKNGFYCSTSADYKISLEGGRITSGSRDLLEAERGSWSTVLDAELTGDKTDTADSRVTFSPAAGSKITWSGVLSGDGGMILDGAGTMTLTQSPEYTGTTTIKSGTLVLTADGTFYNLSGGSLNPDGTIAVAAVLNATGQNLTIDQRVKQVYRFDDREYNRKNRTRSLANLYGCQRFSGSY